MPPKHVTSPSRRRKKPLGSSDRWMPSVWPIPTWRLPILRTITASFGGTRTNDTALSRWTAPARSEPLRPQLS
jgi:hypothetical protein